MKKHLLVAVLACMASFGMAQDQQTNHAGTGEGQTGVGAPQNTGTQKKGAPSKKDIQKATKPEGGEAAESGVQRKVVQLKDAKGQDVGTATLNAGTRGVVIKLDVKNLPEGEHGIHFHQVAKCDPPDFKSAGPHFNPTNKQHGLKNPQGAHAGDMKNISVKKDGTAKTTITDDHVVLGQPGVSNSLFANGGTALVIHAKADDEKTDPAGNSGDRIACGVITP